ncbi:MerR family transcriptional regulator [Paenibacillus bovis]|uniref:helix-turn-helix domain-containing protein n=1 Tax=Paenibacillus bovis TaxID=1616788 RepID=UPI000762213B
MNPYLTISELARLMNVSTHQIRYFEEQGVLLPACVADNQYRLYGTDEVYRLSHILLLRKLGIPVRQIRKSMDSFTADQYSQLLQDSMNQLDQQIRQLTRLKHLTASVIDEYEQHYTSVPDKSPYQIVSCPLRKLQIWTVLQTGEVLTARKMLQLNPYPEDLFETDLYYIEQDNQLLLCYEQQENQVGGNISDSGIMTNTISCEIYANNQHDAVSDLSLAAGSYLSAYVRITEEDELHLQIQQLEQYMDQQQLLPAGPLILIEKSYLSLFDNASLHYELQMPLSTDTPLGRSSHDKYQSFQPAGNNDPSLLSRRSACCLYTAGSFICRYIRLYRSIGRAAADHPADADLGTECSSCRSHTGRCMDQSTNDWSHWSAVVYRQFACWLITASLWLVKQTVRLLEYVQIRSGYVCTRT